MNLQELFDLREEIKTIYENERNKMKIEHDDINKNIQMSAIKDIEKEYYKVEELIKIYQKDDMDYILMMLERLYIFLTYEITEEEYNNKSEDEKFDMFNMIFPDEWVLLTDQKQKEELLLDAISSNKTLYSKSMRIGGEL